MPTCTTKRCGEVVYHAADVIHLPAGLVGLPTLRRWLILEPADDAPLMWCQSLDREDFGFPVARPSLFKAGYEAAHDWAALAGEPGSDAFRVLVITTVHPGGTTITGNLLAPLVIDMRNGRGAQVILDSEVYGLRHEIDYAKFSVAQNTDSSDNGGAAGSAADGTDGGAEAAVKTPEPAGV